MNNLNTHSDASDAGEVIDLEAYTLAGKKPPIGKKYKVMVEKDIIIFDHQIVTGKEILEKSGRNPECFSLYLKLKGCDFEKITHNEKIDLAKPGIEHFTVKPTDVFHYLVDDEPETTEEAELTPNQILEFAGIMPVKDYYLVQINPDGSQTSYKDKPNIMIKMVCPKMVFVSAFRGETPVSCNLK